jgi:hypothetical protein
MSGPEATDVAVGHGESNSSGYSGAVATLSERAWRLVASKAIVSAYDLERSKRMPRSR